MIDALQLFIEHHITALELSAPITSFLISLSLLSGMLICAALALLIARTLIQKVLVKLVLRSRTKWDDALYEHGFFARLAHLAPAVVINLFANVTSTPTTSEIFVLRGAQLYIVGIGFSIIFAALNTFEDLYNQSKLAKRASITGFVQIAKLFVAIIALLLGVSILLNKSPVILLSGLTAIAAVLLLIFRDTILGFVSGIQIAANRMFNTGDWIEVPKHGVDGEIVEIGLTNVKIQNWDKTISTLPTYALTNDSVKNWRGMSESDGRRIKRSIFIDMHSVKFCSDDMLSNLSKMRVLQGYLEQKNIELGEYHQKNAVDSADKINARKLTNLGTFRAYLERYLSEHPMINTSMTHMVRQLKPTELGIPLEIYCFSAEQRWAEYEQIQADIFDHVIATLPLFELRVYQRDGVPHT